MDARTEDAIASLGEAARKSRERAEMAAQLEELMVEREQAAAQRDAAAEARDRKSRIRTTVALVVVAIVAVAGVGLSVYATRVEANRTEDVVAALQKPVAEQVLADGRKESADAARGVLRAANSRLAANRLPIVPEPPADALSVLVQLQANRAQLLADFGTVDFIAEGFRDRFGQDGAFPASFLDQLPVTAAPDPDDAGDGVVEVLPSDDGPSAAVQPPARAAGGTVDSREPRVPPAQPAPRVRPPGTRTAPSVRTPAPAPGPALPPRDRGLCLLGLVLCNS